MFMPERLTDSEVELAPGAVRTPPWFFNPAVAFVVSGVRRRVERCDSGRGYWPKVLRNRLIAAVRPPVEFTIAANVFPVAGSYITTAIHPMT